MKIGAVDSTTCDRCGENPSEPPSIFNNLAICHKTADATGEAAQWFVIRLFIILLCLIGRPRGSDKPHRRPRAACRSALPLRRWGVVPFRFLFRFPNGLGDACLTRGFGNAGLWSGRRCYVGRGLRRCARQWLCRDS